MTHARDVESNPSKQKSLPVPVTAHIGNRTIGLARIVFEQAISNFPKDEILNL